MKRTSPPKLFVFSLQKENKVKLQSYISRHLALGALTKEDVVPGSTKLRASYMDPSANAQT